MGRCLYCTLGDVRFDGRIDKLYISSLWCTHLAKNRTLAGLRERYLHNGGHAATVESAVISNNHNMT